MTNDVNITPGSGAKVATHDDGTAHHQRYVPGRCGTATLTNVNDTASSTAILAAATRTRAGAIIFNDSSSILYIKYGTTASTTSFTYRVEPFGTWEMLTPIYDGAIDGIWSADSTGAARITELTI